LAPCLFFKRFPGSADFAIIAVYVDDMLILGSEHGIQATKALLGTHFRTKELGAPKLCLGLQIIRTSKGLFLSQANYLRRILERFNFESGHPSPVPLLHRNLFPDKDIYAPTRDGEAPLDAKFPYLSALGALLYLAMGTRPDISFAISFLARFSSNPAERHWRGIKQVFRYLRGTADWGLHFLDSSKCEIVGYADRLSIRSFQQSIANRLGFLP
jgi:hypothetical protein